MKKYDLWFYSKEDKVWKNLNRNKSESEIIRDKYNAFETSTKCNLPKTLFKIAEYGDTSWMKHIPQYLLEKGNKRNG